MKNIENLSRDRSLCVCVFKEPNGNYRLKKYNNRNRVYLPAGSASSRKPRRTTQRLPLNLIGYFLATREVGRCSLSAGPPEIEFCLLGKSKE